MDQSPGPDQTRRVGPSLEVPYYAQMISPDWIGPCFDQGIDPVSDPAWVLSGAASPQEYAYWASRGCGIACVKMVAEAFGGPQLNLMAWINWGLDLNGYIIRSGNHGQVEELGWDHRVLARLLEQHRISATAGLASPPEIAQYLAEGRLVIASVTYELGRPGPLTRNSGHLVVVTGVELNGDRPTAFFIHNPSGRTQELRQNARLDSTRFTRGYSGRMIVAGNQN